MKNVIDINLLTKLVVAIFHHSRILLTFRERSHSQIYEYNSHLKCLKIYRKYTYILLNMTENISLNGHFGSLSNIWRLIT